ncbi:hypothetical protein CP533_5839 [Ophiocordyceps camponoti-saundersi (nom. inval.)]|nr:hypothetical protein CP533_5839 [Ophiocordyceps camponoti-saundersi (nom. inval.)]
MAPPARMNLRRAASYNNSNIINNNNSNYYINQPQSATSSRFGFDHLLVLSSSSTSSPPPPSPSLLPRPAESCRSRKWSRKWKRRRLIQNIAARAVGSARSLVCSGGIILALWFAVRLLLTRTEDHVDADEARRLSMLLPDFPTPVVISDSRWTVSIPRRHPFPLSISQYAAMTESCRSLSSSYVDVQEAERAGLLPPTAAAAAATTTTVQSGHFVGLDDDATDTVKPLPVCDRSLTFVLESTDPGLGRSLLMLWVLYAVAKEQKRAFFVDDSRWAYGRYKDILRPPPRPSCRPPPRHQMVPCPARARHLVVSAATAEDIVPALLGFKKGSSQQSSRRRLLDLAGVGYRHLFELVEEDADYVGRRIRQLREKAGLSFPPAPIVGLHVRRGDRHPFEYQYRDTYIPTQVFADRARWLVEAHYNETKGAVGPSAAVTVLASDDPTVHGQSELSDAVLAQQRIRLASNEEAGNGETTPTHSDPRFMHRFTEEGQGWEGGFFPLIFWNLGAQRKNNAVAEVERPESPSELTLRLRGFIARAYVMDLAVLAGASDKVVCAVSAMGCRLLAVMMGWDRAMEQGEWVNVDGGHQGWTGL